MKKLPAISDMEHITSKEFGERMDAVLDRVIKENIALIIDHEEKSYVLCPANWFEFPGMEHIELMVKNAVRYAFAVDNAELTETFDMVREMLPALSEGCIRQLFDVIKDKDGDADGKEWASMKLILKAALSTTEGKETNGEL